MREQDIERSKRTGQKENRRTTRGRANEHAGRAGRAREQESKSQREPKSPER
jgi:hypothetical protein